MGDECDVCVSLMEGELPDVGTGLRAQGKGVLP